MMRCRHCGDPIEYADYGAWVDENGLRSCAPRALRHEPSYGEDEPDARALADAEDARRRLSGEADDDPEAHYYPDPSGRYPIGPGVDALSYGRLVKHVQQAGEHAMIHAHAEDADVWCMDHGCEVWMPHDAAHEAAVPAVTANLRRACGPDRGQA